jgi:hypothetical protein
MPQPKIKYGRYDGHAVRYTRDEAWELVDGAWRETEPVFVARLTRQAYRETFGPVPALPRAAFSSDPSRRIRYGWYDFGPCVFNHHEAWWCFNGTWREISVTEVCPRLAAGHERRTREGGMNYCATSPRSSTTKIDRLKAAVSRM